VSDPCTDFSFDSAKVPESAISSFIVASGGVLTDYSVTPSESKKTSFKTSVHQDETSIQVGQTSTEQMTSSALDGIIKLSTEGSSYADHTSSFTSQTPRQTVWSDKIPTNTPLFTLRVESTEAEVTTLNTTLVIPARNEVIVKRESMIYYWTAIALALSADIAFFVRLMYVEARVVKREHARESAQTEPKTVVATTCSLELDPCTEISTAPRLINMPEEILKEESQKPEAEVNEMKTEKWERNKKCEDAIDSLPVCSLPLVDEPTTGRAECGRARFRRTRRVKVSDGVMHEEVMKRGVDSSKRSERETKEQTETGEVKERGRGKRMKTRKGKIKR
jgi:hypothetical protein